MLQMQITFLKGMSLKRRPGKNFIIGKGGITYV